MKRKYREAMRAQLRQQYAYIDGLTDDEQAAEMMDWHEEYMPPYEASTQDHYQDNQLPF